jgi:hypothetical protein
MEGSLLQEEDGVDTDRTDYSGLGGAPRGSGGKDNEIQKALEEASQQHQWAMEVCPPIPLYYPDLDHNPDWLHQVVCNHMKGGGMIISSWNALGNF